MAEDAASVGTGLVKGAAVGAAVAGPIGAVIGGVIGAIGGIFASKSKRYLKYAAAEQQNMAEREAGLQRRNLVRQMYQARGMAVAAAASESGGLSSSAPEGAISSIGAQGSFNLNFFDQQVLHQKLENQWLAKAHKAADSSNVVNSLLDTAQGMATSGLFSKAPPSMGSSTSTFGSTGYGSNFLPGTSVNASSGLSGQSQNAFNSNFFIPGG